MFTFIFQDGRLHSGDHILHIGDVDVRGFGSEQVAQVLRQAGSHVRLIVARPIIEPATMHNPDAPIVATIQLDQHLEQILSVLEKQDQMLIAKQEELEQQGLLEHVQVHEVSLPNNDIGGGRDVHRKSKLKPVLGESIIYLL